MIKNKFKQIRLILCALTLVLGGGGILQTYAQTCDANSPEGNCVVFVRTETSFPSPATSYSEKLAKINHHFPTVGSVAIMPVSGSNAPYGHVSVVKSVSINGDGTLSLTVDEGNWIHCVKSYGVSITEAGRNIAGYYDPNYASSSAPTPDLTSVSNASGTPGNQFYVTASGSGFDPSTAKAVILGGACNSFNSCQVPNSVMTSKSSTSLTIPLTLNSTGNYQLYIFNSGSGKTSQGKLINIHN